eukprot:1590655-Prymnesium_polylepis.1
MEREDHQGPKHGAALLKLCQNCAFSARLWHVAGKLGVNELAYSARESYAPTRCDLLGDNPKVNPHPAMRHPRAPGRAYAAHASAALRCEHITGNGRYVGQRPKTRVHSCLCSPRAT